MQKVCILADNLLSVFLKRLYQEWRVMFWIVVIFISFQMLFIYKGIENIPFFLYHMFSTRHTTKQVYKIYAIRIDSNYYDVTKLSNRENEMLIGSAERYVQLKGMPDPIRHVIDSRFSKAGEELRGYLYRQLLNDSSIIGGYPEWWARYFSKVSGIKVRRVSLVTFDVAFAPHLHKQSDDSILFTVKLPDE
jgi:hypothetical protein